MLNLFQPLFMELFTSSVRCARVQLSIAIFLVLNLFQDPETSSGLERISITIWAIARVAQKIFNGSTRIQILKISVKRYFLSITIRVHYTCFLIFGYFLFKEVCFPLKRNHIHKIKWVCSIIFSLAT